MPKLQKKTRKSGGKSALQIRLAVPDDALAIADLYNQIYEGSYPDPVMSHLDELRRALRTPEYCWVVANSGDKKIVASVVYRYDAHNALAKVYGAVVNEDFRGQQLMDQLMNFGYQDLRRRSPPVEVVYSLARTVSIAPQKLTTRLGYKKLGLFPNVHKTRRYETHALTGLFSAQALQSRFTDFELHPKLADLFAITRKECGLPDLKVARRSSRRKSSSRQALELEVIHAPRFVHHRFQNEQTKSDRQNWFFPFHEPNLLLTSPDQSCEVFCYLSQLDKHCVIIGIRDRQKRGLDLTLQSASSKLHDLGVRYMEVILRADEIDKIESVIQSEFIPCAYFPAMYLSGRQRFDFVACSRSFEALHFRDLQVEA